MDIRHIKVGETASIRKRATFFLRDASGQPVTGEAGQPQVSVNNGPWTNTGIGALVEVGHGDYYAELTNALLAEGAIDVGSVIRTRYAGAGVPETRGTTFILTAWDHYAGEVDVASVLGSPDRAAALDLSLGLTSGALVRRRRTLT